MNFQIILFVTTFSAIFFGAHALLYFSFIKFFAISSINARNILLLVLLFFCFSFILASFTMRMSDSFFARKFYALSSLWVGLLVNLLLAALVIFLVRFLVIGKVNMPLVAGFFFLSAVAFSFYGIFHAFNPVIKKVDISFINLPENWKGKKIVQLSDVHIGGVHDIGFLDEIVNKVNALKPDIVFITGDLFDGMDGESDSVSFALDRLEAPKGVIFVTGNHEAYFGLEKALAILAKTKITVLDDEMEVIDGLQVLGVSYDNPDESSANHLEQNRDIVSVIKSFTDFDKNKASILLYHAPMRIGEVKAAGVNLMLSGHTHNGQLFPFNFVTKIIFKGKDYGLYQEGDFNLYTSSGVGTWGPPMRTSAKPEIVAITLQ